MSFKEFLEDYDAKEEEAIRRYLAGYARGHTPEDPIYPPPGRFPGVKLPYARAEMCNIWGVIPFHKSVLLPLPCVDSRRNFDLFFEDSGVNSATIPDVMRFARETGRVAFGLTGHATLYEHLDFLEPLIREFRPPRGLAMPLEVLVGRKAFRAEHAAFMDLARHGLSDFVSGFMRSTGGDNRALIDHNIFTLGVEYVFLRKCGYEDLANAVESEIVANPQKAVQLLQALDNVLIAPRLDLTGGSTVLGSTLLQGIRATPGVEQLGPTLLDSRGVDYDVGKFILSKIVVYPETQEGCTQLIQEYDSSGLSRVRDAFFKAIEDENADLLTSSATSISELCESVWVRASKFGWVEKFGGIAPMITVGVVGDLASGIPGVGFLAALGGGLADHELGDASGRLLKSGIGKLLGKSHLVSIYDFQATLPKKISS